MAYWETVGATKTFTHPLNLGWLAEVPHSARILDYGCGYGRTMAELTAAGFTSVAGADVSAALLARGRTLHPGLRFDVMATPPLVPHEPATFDAVLLFAVLTCVPADQDQQALIAEVRRVLKPGGLLYVSDLLRHGDESRYSPDGVFTTSDGARCRHHDRPALHRLLADFTLRREEELTVTTMNGHEARGVQLLAQYGPTP
ncbi:class I SAM-dependent methyltransferase [Dactylosporangium sp. CS-033363]|uniref:class I SAM-dependent methyltransferase n=1 Tax=Dactylosporangium sp. CS-033363 TaxID=3239935 RepID=UPI003D9434B1